MMLVNRHGQQYSIESSAAPLRLANGRIIGVVRVFRDITESRQLFHELNFQATHDALTGLVNGMEFELRLKRALDRAKPLHDSHSALLYMDLDQFKIVIDTCGHADGDELLRQLAQVYCGHMRERDTLARIGGDEFALIVEHCAIDEAITITEKILEATARFRFACEGHVFFTNDISHMLGRKTIAEHVTSESILQRLRDIGVDLAQRSWLGAPQLLVAQGA
jgi:diguanylate cyclase (GGDEF)-like protein